MSSWIFPQNNAKKSPLQNECLWPQIRRKLLTGTFLSFICSFTFFCCIREFVYFIWHSAVNQFPLHETRNQTVNVGSHALLICWPNWFPQVFRNRDKRFIKKFGDLRMVIFIGSVYSRNVKQCHLKCCLVFYYLTLLCYRNWFQIVTVSSIGSYIQIRTP